MRNAEKRCKQRKRVKEVYKKRYVKRAEEHGKGS